MFESQFMSDDPTARDVRRFKSALWAAIRDRGFAGVGPSIFRIQVGEMYKGRQSLIVTVSSLVESLKLESLFPSFNKRRVVFVYTDALDVHATFSEILSQAAEAGKNLHVIAQPDDEQEAIDVDVFFVDPEAPEGNDDGNDNGMSPFSVN